MRMTVSTGLLAMMMIGMNECDSKPAAPVPAPEQPSARFLPYSQITGLALDTKTGLLCHTFNKDIDTYVPTGRSHTPGVTVGPDIVMGHQSFDSAPLCVDLSQNEEQTVDAALFAEQDFRDLSGEKSYYYARGLEGDVHQFDSKEQADDFRNRVLHVLEKGRERATK